MCYRSGRVSPCLSPVGDTARTHHADPGSAPSILACAAPGTAVGVRTQVNVHSAEVASEKQQEYSVLILVIRSCRVTNRDTVDCAGAGGKAGSGTPAL